MDLAILISAHNARETLPGLVEQLDKACEKLDLDWEVLVVDDGSTDRTFELVEELAITNDRIWAIRLRRRVGPAAALSVGFDSTEAEHVITVDPAGRTDPDDIATLHQKLKGGADLVHGGSAGGPRGFRNECGRGLHLHGSLHRHAPLIATRQGWVVEELSLKSASDGGSGLRGANPHGVISLASVLYFSPRRQRVLDLSVGIGAALAVLGCLLFLYLLIIWIAGVAIAGKPLLTLGATLIVTGTVLACFGLLGQLLLSVRREFLGVAAERELIEQVLEPIPVEA